MLLLARRALARRGRRYVRLGLLPYRTDRADAESVAAMFDSLNKLLLARYWERAWSGQPSVALELHVGRDGAGVDPGGAGASRAQLALSCPRELAPVVAVTLRSAYPHVRLIAWSGPSPDYPRLTRLKKRDSFCRALDMPSGESAEPSPVDRLLRLMATAAPESMVQLSLTPVPAWFERWAMRPRSRRRLAQRRWQGRPGGPNPEGGSRGSERDDVDSSAAQSLRGALFFGELRVLAPTRRAALQIGSELRSRGGANQLVVRESAIRHRLARVYRRRIDRGEGNPIPSWRRGVYGSRELAGLWRMPSVGFAGVPLERSAVPLVPAPPAIGRPDAGPGLLDDEFGPITLHRAVRWQNVAVPGAVGTGKTSLLVASTREDLARPRCAVIVFDPKGDAADAALSVVPEQRTCTLLDLARPTCGFNPLAVNASPDSIADSVVAALRHLFSDSDIRASSDRYLRSAIVAALAYDRDANLWDAARLLSVTEEGRAFRARVGTRIRELPEFKEIADFFSDELPTQLEDSRGTTTAKLDAPANKLARLLNVPAIKRVLLNRSLTVDFERIIAGGEVLVVRGALGEMGTGNTAVVMQLLVGMLDAALARQQDLVAVQDRMTVALKIDEAPLVINRGFAATLALKRSAGLETLACWQTDTQWEDPALRDQLEALFAHRVYFATASAQEARSTASLMMAEYSDQVRAGAWAVSTLGHPDVRLYLPRHVAVVSWTTPEGRQPPFIARTAPMPFDSVRLAHHAAAQAARGARAQEDLSQPHWEREAALPPPLAGAADRRSAPPDATLPASYSELVDLEQAKAMRRDLPPAPRGSQALQEGDRAVLEWVAELGCALATQIQRRWHPDRSASTAQRQLKRLWEGGWLERIQFHRPDGGAVPSCYLVTAQTLRMLASARGVEASAAEADDHPARSAAGARRAAHVTGWVTEATRGLGSVVARVRGPAASQLRPLPGGPAGGRAGGRNSGRPLGPSDLKLPGGRRPHGFLRSAPLGGRVDVEEFEPVRADATMVLALAGPGGPFRVELLVSLHPVVRAQRSVRELERYDHLISGWSQTHRRYREPGPPAAVFVCRDAEAARELCQLADGVVTGCWAYPGEEPARWVYPGRQRLFFADERDVHRGRLLAYTLPPLPPDVDGRAARSFAPERREIIAREWRPDADRPPMTV